MSKKRIKTGALLVLSVGARHRRAQTADDRGSFLEAHAPPHAPGQLQGPGYEAAGVFF